MKKLLLLSMLLVGFGMQAKRDGETKPIVWSDAETIEKSWPESQRIHCWDANKKGYVSANKGFLSDELEKELNEAKTVSDLCAFCNKILALSAAAYSKPGELFKIASHIEIMKDSSDPVSDLKSMKSAMCIK